MATELKGILYNGNLMITTDGSGVPIVFTETPSVEPGYVAKDTWVDEGTQITQHWSVEAEEGSYEAALCDFVYNDLMPSMSDEVAKKYPILNLEWDMIGAYKTGDRFRYNGIVYKVLADHVADPSKTPDTATDLYVAL